MQDFTARVAHYNNSQNGRSDLIIHLPMHIGRMMGIGERFVVTKGATEHDWEMRSAAEGERGTVLFLAKKKGECGVRTSVYDTKLPLFGMCKAVATHEKGTVLIQLKPENFVPVLQVPPRRPRVTGFAEALAERMRLLEVSIDTFNDAVFNGGIYDAIKENNRLLTRAQKGNAPSLNLNELSVRHSEYLSRIQSALGAQEIVTARNQYKEWMRDKGISLDLNPSGHVTFDL